MIKTFDYLGSLKEIEEEISEAIFRVLHSGRLMLGAETAMQSLQLSIPAELVLGTITPVRFI